METEENLHTRVRTHTYTHEHTRTERGRELPLNGGGAAS